MIDLLKRLFNNHFDVKGNRRNFTGSRNTPRQADNPYIVEEAKMVSRERAKTSSTISRIINVTIG
jgi:hypothetical protein